MPWMVNSQDGKRQHRESRPIGAAKGVDDRIKFDESIGLGGQEIRLGIQQPVCWKVEGWWRKLLWWNNRGWRVFCLWWTMPREPKDATIQAGDSGERPSRELVGQAPRLRPEGLRRNRHGIGFCLRWIHLQGTSRHARTRALDGSEEEPQDLPKAQDPSSKDEGDKTFWGKMWS